MNASILRVAALALVLGALAAPACAQAPAPTHPGLVYAVLGGTRVTSVARDAFSPEEAIMVTSNHDPSTQRRMEQRSGFRLVQAMAALLVLALLLAPSARAGIRDEKPNLIGGELLGRGLLLTLNYERFVSNQFGFGAGLMAIGGSGGMVAIVPLYLSALTGDQHSLYTSGGITILSGGGSVEDFESEIVFQVSLGYHYHSRGGFFVRPLFAYMAPTDDPGDFIVWPGLTIGGSF
jgi:hypothetical protein